MLQDSILYGIEFSYIFVGSGCPGNVYSLVEMNVFKQLIALNAIWELLLVPRQNVELLPALKII